MIRTISTLTLLTIFKEMNLNNLGNEGCAHVNICSTHFPLMDLPSLILDRLLTFLDKATLINLRAVCWTTRNLVEQPKHIQRVQILIRNAARLEEIKNSAVKCTNICIREDHSWTWANKPTIFMPLIQSSLGFLTRLKIKCLIISGKYLLILLSNVGPQLRDFVCVGTLLMNADNLETLRRPDPIGLQAEVDEMNRNFEECKEALEKNLIGLQHVELGNICRNPGTAYRLLIMLLTCCPNLRTLNVPTIDSSEIVRNQCAQFNCEPILDYLKRKLSRGEKQPLLKIDLCHRPLWSSWKNTCKQIEGLFPLAPSILIEMANLCERTGVKLYNVPNPALPPSNALTQKQRESINETVASILCANVMTGIRDNYIPPGCPVKILIYFYTRETEPDLSNFQLPNDSINIVSIICDERYSKILVPILFQRVWPTVTELQILNRDEDEVWSEKNGVHGKLVSVFPNLRKLRLGSISIGPVFDFLDGLEDSLEMLYLGSVTGCLDLQAISNWMSKMNKLKYFGLGNSYYHDPSVVLKVPGYFGKRKWHADD